MCGTAKAAVLEGDHVCSDLVASIFYDNKPVNYLIMVCEELKWKVNEREVFNVDTGKTENLRFIRINTIHNYNMTIDSVSLAENF